MQAFLGVNRGGDERRFCQKIREGCFTLFWHDNWVDEECLKIKFPRLFSLSSQKNAKICEMGSQINDSQVWELNQSRQLSPKSREQAESLFNIISCYLPSIAGNDIWIWKNNPKGIYTTSAAYDKLMEREWVEAPLLDMEKTSYKRLWGGWLGSKKDNYLGLETSQRQAV